MIKNPIAIRQNWRHKPNIFTDDVDTVIKISEAIALCISVEINKSTADVQIFFHFPHGACIGPRSVNYLKAESLYPFQDWRISNIVQIFNLRFLDNCSLICYDSAHNYEPLVKLSVIEVKVWLITKEICMTCPWCHRSISL